MAKKKNIFEKINTWLKNLFLEDVDKEYKVYLSNTKKPVSKKNPVDKIEKRFNEQRNSIG